MKSYLPNFARSPYLNW